MKRGLSIALITAALAVASIAVWTRAGGETWGRMRVEPNLEDRLGDGSFYTPSTQSFLRARHWLDSVTAARIDLDRGHHAEIELIDPSGEAELTLAGLPLDQLVPRLHYRSAEPPDAFDAFNLMLAEYSRNSLSVPRGSRGDALAHFETTLTEDRPWTLDGDYEFRPNRGFRPVRVAVVNNCLRPGLWELSASDRSGEIYHSWFEVGADHYERLVARTNDVGEDFVRRALAWRTDEVPLDLDRLRRDPVDLGPTSARLHSEGGTGYSSQDSRRKLAQQYVLVQRGDALEPPSTLGDLTAGTIHLSSFVEPGKYSSAERRAFELGFLRDVEGAHVFEAHSTTDYDWRRAVDEKRVFELHVDLGDWRLVLGNLPPELLVPQEDFAIHGFGVGVLASDGVAERRRFLIDDGPAPSFAYLCRDRNGELLAVNSHEYGIEQVFLRSHLLADSSWWEVTLTSYERIVDVVKYRVEIPPVLVDELRAHAANYSAPLYRSYRDDNLR